AIGFVSPQIRARDAFAAVEKRLVNADDHREIGDPPIVRHRAPDILITDNHGPTGHAKRFALVRNKEDQADAWVLQQIVEGIDAAVAATIRDGEGRIVKTSYEARAIF